MSRAITTYLYSAYLIAPFLTVIIKSSDSVKLKLLRFHFYTFCHLDFKQCEHVQRKSLYLQRSQWFSAKAIVTSSPISTNGAQYFGAENLSESRRLFMALCRAVLALSRFLRCWKKLFMNTWVASSSIAQRVASSERAPANKKARAIPTTP